VLRALSQPESFLARSLRALGLAALRIAPSATMLFAHGLPKLTGFAEKSASFPDPLGVGSTTSLVLAIFGEVFAPVFVALGLGTRLFAMPVAFTMGVAFFVVHAGDEFRERELAIVYLFVFAALVFTGPGELSIDHLIKRAWQARKRRRSSAEHTMRVR
jgi:putative oxidoreductase